MNEYKVRRSLEHVPEPLEGRLLRDPAGEIELRQKPDGTFVALVYATDEHGIALWYPPSTKRRWRQRFLLAVEVGEDTWANHVRIKAAAEAIHERATDFIKRARDRRIAHRPHRPGSAKGGRPVGTSCRAAEKKLGRIPRNCCLNCGRTRSRYHHCDPKDVTAIVGFEMRDGKLQKVMLPPPRREP